MLKGSVLSILVLLASFQWVHATEMNPVHCASLVSIYSDEARIGDMDRVELIGILDDYIRKHVIWDDGSSTPIVRQIENAKVQHRMSIENRGGFIRIESTNKWFMEAAADYISRQRLNSFFDIKQFNLATDSIQSAVIKKLSSVSAWRLEHSSEIIISEFTHSVEYLVQIVEHSTNPKIQREALGAIEPYIAIFREKGSNLTADILHTRAAESLGALKRNPNLSSEIQDAVAQKLVDLGQK